ncbi:MAG: MBL fold metallo-hydrolase [Bacteroidaceae bacterium]|nr:MBL fold metallo-hydrolase [Bacteroidaceae bacterium]
MPHQSSLFSLPVDFISFGSGSSGNCYYLRHGDYGLLIDLGVGVRRFLKDFSAYGCNINQVKAVLLTHDHLDHVRAAGNFSQKLHWPIYATEPVFAGIRRNPIIRRKVPDEYAHFIHHGEPFQLGPFTIESFPVPHDASDNSGYFITCDGISFCLITDAGTETPDICHYVARAQYLVIESNHDPDMLASGPYPLPLQHRIRSGRGHLSNPQCAELLRQHVNPDLLDGLWLCHLSQENNRPELAVATATQALADLPLRCAPVALRRVQPTGPYILSEK